MRTLTASIKVLMIVLNPLKRLHKPVALMGVTSLAAMASVAMGVAQPAQAANVSCQAIDSTSIISGTIPSPACSSPVAVNDNFAIDFTNVFNSNFGVGNTYSLQLANIGSGTLDFQDVQLEITGAYSNNTGSGNFSTLTPIAVWTAVNSGFDPTGQGITNYTPSQSGGPFFPNGPTAYKAASFSLASPQPVATPFSRQQA